MKTDGGDPAEDVDDGYELKGEQARMALEYSETPLCQWMEFFNVREDDLEKLNAFLLDLVRKLRAFHQRTPLRRHF